MFFYLQLSSRFELPIIATADNCLLTCYNFLASHQSDYHVVCENIAANQNPVDSKDDIKERVSYGQAHFVPCISAIRPPTNTSSVTTTTSFGLTTSTYQESATATTSSYPRTPPAANSNGMKIKGFFRMSILFLVCNDVIKHLK